MSINITILLDGAKIYQSSPLFMAAMYAIRYDQNLKAFYERLQANGKQTTQAQIAVIRKSLSVLIHFIRMIGDMM